MRILGIDLGISSLGWAIVETSENNSRIIDGGVRIFNPAETPKEKLSLAQQRREFRTTRRRLRRKKSRLKKLNKLFMSFDVSLLTTSVTSLWEKGLISLLTDNEMATLLYHTLKYRGTDFDDNYTSSTQNRSANYQAIQKVFTQQRLYGHKLASLDIENFYSHLFLYEKEPQDYEKFIGYCKIFPQEKRAFKHSYTAEEFLALSRILGTKVILDSQEYPLVFFRSLEEIFSFLKDQRHTTIAQLKKFLQLPSSVQFKGIPSDKEFFCFQGILAIEQRIGKEFTDKILSFPTIYNNLIELLNWSIIHPKRHYSIFMKVLQGIDLTRQDKRFIVQQLEVLKFRDTINYSLKALHEKLLPSMREGKRLHEIIALYDKPLPELSCFLPPFNQTQLNVSNPTVLRALSEFRKVINALLRHYGYFDRIHFELAREINTKDERKKAESQVRHTAKLHHEATTKLIAKEIKVTSHTITLQRLFDEQNGICLSCLKALNEEELLTENIKVSYIIPRYISYDESFHNKVLLHTKCQFDKTKHHLTSEQKQFLDHCHHLSSKKRSLLIRPFYQNENNFRDKDLNDTRYMAYIIKNYTQDYLQFSSHPSRRYHVFARNGKLTNALRYQWNVGLKNRSYHFHHLEDAVLIAFSSESMLQKLLDYYRNKDEYHIAYPKISLPYPQFEQDLKKLLTPYRYDENHRERILVSKSPRKKLSGPAHKQTLFNALTLQNKGRSLSGRPVYRDNHAMENALMVRIDVFEKNKKFFLVPLYVADFTQDKLPCHAIYGKNYKSWILLDESYTFKFSLFKEDFIEITTPPTLHRPQTTFRGYVVGVHSGNGSLIINPIESNSEELSFGVRNLVELKKFDVDPLGYIHEVKKENRLIAATKKKKVL